MNYGSNKKAWLYLLPAIAFLGLFMVYPLVDVIVYSFEESFNFASQTYTGTGLYNYSYVLRDPYFLQAVKKHIYTGYYHSSTFNRICSAYITCSKFYKKTKGSFPDSLFSALCYQHTGRWTGVYDPV